jgi:DNA-binding CsgD family transcriptional regulator
VLLMAAVFLVEVLTPDVVVAALQLLPVLAALWLLSNRSASFVAAFAGLFFGLSLMLESTNRLTLLVIGASAVAVLTATRLHASALATLISTRPMFTKLTERERQVARLAGQAYTAAEIGVRLHIGERTVETHLANTYSKLRISSRRELIRIASRLESPEAPVVRRPGVLGPPTSPSSLRGRR